MKFSDQFNKNRSSYPCHWINFAAAGLLAVAVAGCGGSSGGDTTAAAPADGAAAVAAAPAVTAPTGTAPVNVATITPTQFAALTPTVTVGGVAIGSPPVVTFAMSDGPTTNNPVVGIGYTTQTATATLPSQAWLRFSLAKLVPGANGSPSKWVNYIVTTVPTYKSSTDKTIVAPVPTRPTTDTQGTLVDNKNGTYTYTFYRDITKIKDQIAAMTVTAPNAIADLGDLTYDATVATLPHRLTIQISGNARGTGTNTADGSNSGVTAVPLANPVNVVYDFIPATGKAIAAADLQREVVAVANCNECHQKLTLHGSRIETKYCVVCHTDQLKYGFANVASTAGKFPKVTETAAVNATTGITSYSYSPNMFLADGESLGNFPIMVHKIHQGKELVKETYNMANVVFNNKGYSMLGGGQKMCSKCHDETSKVAVNAVNWNTKPSRLACGSCHDGIKWSDGTGTTLAGATTGHVGKSQSSDATCALCHGAADIKIYHRTENVTTHNPTITPGLVSFTYEIKSAAVNATSNDLTVEFRINSATADANGVLGTATPVTFSAAAAAMANPLTGFTGAPGFLLAYATAQDNIATPVDYNNTGMAQAQAPTVSIAALLDTAKAATVGTLSAKSADGYYTATIKGNGSATGCGSGSNTYPCYFPVGAKLRAVGLQGYFTQVSPAMARHAIAVVKAIDTTARRIVVDKTKCANCHEWFEGHGGNRVYNTEICVMCHVPGLATSGRGATAAQLKAYAWSTADKKILADWSIDPTTFGNGADDALKYPVTTNNFKDMIHGIHAGRDRVTPFKDARNRSGTQTLLDFRRMDFPGVLNNCETCHAAGTYSNVSASALASTYEHINTAYSTVKTQANALASISAKTVAGTDTVTSPFAAACISCHDSVAAASHMATNGGMIQVTRSTFATMATPGNGEACATCHGAGRTEDISVVHK